MKLWSNPEWPDGSPDQGWEDGERILNFVLRAFNTLLQDVRQQQGHSRPAVVP